MAWLQITFKIQQAENIELITDRLMEETNALSATMVDAKDEPIFEPGPGETKLWDNTNIIALYYEELDVPALIEQIKENKIIHNDFGYELEKIEDQDWERAWMDNFHPMKFGHKLWICPSWCEPPEPDAVNILLDPGLAFGTGTHPTTSLCLKWMDPIDFHDKSVIDLGCGSGILAIAAKKLGAKSVLGIDIDPQAIEASLENSKRNGLEGQIEYVLPEEVDESQQVDILVANILSGPLKYLSSMIINLVKPGGYICLSGILDEQVESVAKCYEKDFDLNPFGIENDWRSISGQKHK